MKQTYGGLISIGALIALIGFITSGPLGFVLVKLVSPQPPWTSPAEFAANYNVIQDVPYYFGLLLIGGMIMLIAGHYLSYEEDNKSVKFILMLSVVLATIFSALISFNYICQTIYVRHLALNYGPEYDTAIGMLTMANPSSLCWAIEMSGYGVLGVATWLMAGYYTNKNQPIRWFLISNGILSTTGVILCVINISWVMTTWGLIAYMAWNALMIVLVVLIYTDTRRRLNVSAR
jgi:hypothetical protein